MNTLTAAELFQIQERLSRATGVSTFWARAYSEDVRRLLRLVEGPSRAWSLDGVGRAGQTRETSPSSRTDV